MIIVSLSHHCVGIVAQCSLEIFFLNCRLCDAKNNLTHQGMDRTPLVSSGNTNHLSPASCCAGSLLMLLVLLTFPKTLNRSENLTVWRPSQQHLGILYFFVFLSFWSVAGWNVTMKTAISISLVHIQALLCLHRCNHLQVSTGAVANST